MRLRDAFDIPERITAGSHSPAFEQFLWNWFGDTRAITHGELDLSFLQGLSPEEFTTARELIRRNLKLNYNHIIQGAAALHDIEAVPILRRMLDAETSGSRRLTIAGALWNLVRDPIFIACLDSAKTEREGGKLLAGAHVDQVLWLDDERAVYFLIDLLDQRDREARTQALGLLNTLEFGWRTVIPAGVPHGPEDYRRRRSDPVFREKMTAAVRKANRERKDGMAFGWSEEAKPG